MTSNNNLPDNFIAVAVFEVSLDVYKVDLKVKK